MTRNFVVSEFHASRSFNSFSDFYVSSVYKYRSTLDLLSGMVENLLTLFALLFLHC